MKLDTELTELTLKHNEQEIRITSECGEDCYNLMQLIFQLCVGAGYNASSVADAMYSLGIEHTGDAG